MNYAIHPSTLMTLETDGERVVLTMGDFLAANAELNREPIIAQVRKGLVYRGGGGAAPEWSLSYLAQGVMHWPRVELVYMAERGDGALQTLALAEIERRKGAMALLSAELGRIVTPAALVHP